VRKLKNKGIEGKKGILPPHRRRRNVLAVGAHADDVALCRIWGRYMYFSMLERCQNEKFPNPNIFI